MTTREELDARLAEFDRRRAAADAVLSRWTENERFSVPSVSPVPSLPPVPDLPIANDGARSRSTGRLGRWLGRTA